MPPPPFKPVVWLGDLGDAFRAVYLVRLADRVYVLHAFQKKAKRGSDGME